MLMKGELVKLHVLGQVAEGKVVKVQYARARIQLNLPICSELGEILTISRKIGSEWR